jgi:aminoglycoside phosphotransferase family enzyme/predicted kinase
VSEPPAALDIRALLDPAAHPGPVTRVDLVETHLSWLLLTDQLVYKINRPLRLDFVDFSSPTRREASCREALRLNRRLAPRLYLGVVAVTQESDGRPRLEGTGRVIEHALKMRRFPDDALLSRVLAAGRLRPEHLDDLAAQIADFHAVVAVAPASSPYGSPQTLHQALREILDSLADGGPEGQHRAQVHALERWCLQRLDAQGAIIRQRKRDGCVRECHGDLHLGNMFLEHDRVTVFDCIDFSPTLRWIDVMEDVAFCVMDLQARGREDFAWRFLDRYLQHSGDYGGLALLRFFVVSRALVRAKVARLRLGQLPAGDPAADEQAAQLRRYLVLAERWTREREPRLLITHGVSGSGKSWLSAQLPERLGALRIRSDLERRRLPTAPPTARYAPETRARVYHRLLELTRIALSAGFDIIVDATFLERRWREAFRQLAEQHDLSCRILACTADEAVMRQRIGLRATEGTDPSEADHAVQAAQLRTVDPLDAAELERAILVATDGNDPIAMVLAGLGIA